LLAFREALIYLGCRVVLVPEVTKSAVPGVTNPSPRSDEAAVPRVTNRGPWSDEPARARNWARSLEWRMRRKSPRRGCGTAQARM